MNRRKFITKVTTGGFLVATGAGNFFRSGLFAATAGAPWIDPAKAKDWLAKWENNILGESRSRYCDKEMSEELGWLVSPFLNGFYYGYIATRDFKWVGMLVDWMDSCVKRSVKEPDEFPGWPKLGTGGKFEDDLYSDSLLGEAMILRPAVLMADEILKTPGLKEKWGDKAQSYIELAKLIFKKWDSRDCWREVKNGGVWVVPLFGIDKQTGKWTPQYEQRKTTGFSNPDNKQNLIALWLIAMFDVTHDPVYRDRAAKWWGVMKSRMQTREGGKYFVWNYWEPAGPWDYNPNSSTVHWVGVHPNGGYYGVDLEGIVTAFEHGIVFNKGDIDKLIATNRDFMWNQQVDGAKFKRIDGGDAAPPWKDTPGVLWTALVPHDETLRKIFLANHNPSRWGALGETPWFLSLAPKA